MEIDAIRKDEDHQAALVEIEGLMRAEAGSPAGERLNLLVTVVEAYEAQRYSIEVPGGAGALSDGAA